MISGIGSCNAVVTTTPFQSTPFLLSPFTLSDKVEKCSAKFLAVCWFVRINFEVHRLRDGFSKSNALLLGQSLPTFIGHDLDKIGDGTLLNSCHLFQFVSLLLTYREVDLLFNVVLFLVFHSHL